MPDVCSQHSSRPSAPPSSSGSPVNLDALAIARSIVRLDPARYGVPGNDTRPSSPRSQSTAPIRYRPGCNPAAAIASVTRIVRPRALRPDHRFHGRRRKVVTVDDQGGADRVGRQQLPDHVRMARQHLRAAIAQMRGQRRAGGDRIADLLWRRRGMAERDAHACGHKVLDERQRAWHLRRERHEHDPAVGGILPALEVVDVRRDDVRARVGAARAILRRHVRAFHVDPGDRRMRACAPAGARPRRTARMRM